MTQGFSRTGSDRLVIRLDSVEKSILQSLTDQIIAFVQPNDPDPDRDPLAALVGIDDAAQISEDPALARLFPDAYRDDPEAADDFRRFTERQLREGKLANATTVKDALTRSGNKVTISLEQASAWLGFLNDVRLALGSRIGISEENHEELADLPDEDPRSGMFEIYDWLTYLQESLVQALMPA